MAADAGSGADAAAAATARCLCFARYFVREPRLSPREPVASMLRFRHLSCISTQAMDHLVELEYPFRPTMTTTCMQECKMISSKSDTDT